MLILYCPIWHLVIGWNTNPCPNHFWTLHVMRAFFHIVLNSLFHVTRRITYAWNSSWIKPALVVVVFCAFPHYGNQWQTKTQLATWHVSICGLLTGQNFTFPSHVFINHNSTDGDSVLSEGELWQCKRTADKMCNTGTCDILPRTWYGTHYSLHTVWFVNRNNIMKRLGCLSYGLLLSVFLCRNFIFRISFMRLINCM